MSKLPAAAVRTGSEAMAEDLDIARLRHLRRPHYGRIAAIAAILLLAVLLVRAFVNGQIDWSTTLEFLFWPTILWGLFNTIWMSFACMALGLVIALACAVGRESDNPVLRNAALFYAWFFRGMPVILQLLIWFNLALVFPRIGIPGIGSWRTVDLITPWMATLLGLGLNSAAYMAEIIRAGMLGVDRGQYEAARAIGMSNRVALRRIIMPQALRIAVPPLGNEFIGLVKLTSLASIIGFGDILRSAQDIYYTNAKVIELLMVPAFWFLVIVTIFTILQSILERRFGRGFGKAASR